MSVSDVIEKMKAIQSKLLHFLDSDNDIKIDSLDFYNYLNETKISDNQHDLTPFLQLLVAIANNHRGGASFFDKIKQILSFFKKEIQQFYSNSEIINIFQSNKRILLFLIKENIITADFYFRKTIISDEYVKAKYPQYFAPELRPFIHEFTFQKDQDDSWISQIKQNYPYDFENLRQNGNNEETICQMIRNDSVEEFIKYVNKINYNLNSTISPSIYETNSFLIENQHDINLIKYATFFGSIQIVRYLIQNNVRFNSDLWLYAIHSNNPELIHYFEENKIEFGDTLYRIYIDESIKCHNNDIKNYFTNKYLFGSDYRPKNTFFNAIKYYNFEFMNTEFIKQDKFFMFTIHDYYFIVNALLQESDCDINKEKIFTILV
ncbi:hypothetical protein M9Y10_020775 [Tritrichomonas musculus]|uniref:DUF3447 domain-containing protein n=1 Tax=Tritrichomonas musculus TaxID=1915356 RepID=A0ABR2HFM3_9EUKA